MRARARAEGHRLTPVTLLAALPPSALILTGIISVQVGAGLAKQLFAVVPPAAVTLLRLWSSAVVMVVLAGGATIWRTVRRSLLAEREARGGPLGLAEREAPGGRFPGLGERGVPGNRPGPAGRGVPRDGSAGLDEQGVPGGPAGQAGRGVPRDRSPRLDEREFAEGGPTGKAGREVAEGRTAGLTHARRSLGIAIVFGLVLATMNFAIYQSFARIPLGVAVTIEFLGPLGVSVAASRRLLDLAWVALAGTGVALLTGDGGHITVAGVLYALVAAACWAAYILLSAATGRRFPGSTGLAIAMVVGALAITPAGAAAGGTVLLRPRVLATGTGIGLLSSVIPYSLELEALRRMPPRVFGILMSLEPAVAALVGLVLLGQVLSAREWFAIGCVIVACIGAARGAVGGEPQA